MAIYLSNVRSALSNLLNESVSPTPWPSERDNFIHWSLERIARIYDWDFSKGIFSGTTDVNGELVLDTGIRRDAEMDIRVAVAGASNDLRFTEINRDDRDNYTQGDYKYFLETDADGTQTLVTTEPSTLLSIVASRAAAVLSDAVPTDFPSALAVAKGALIYAKEFEDKDADTSVEDAKFQQIMEEIMGSIQRSNPRQRAVTRQEVYGRHTGEVSGDRGSWRY